MMRSLWSGVSGLQSHQIAMDVEGNNIANVNTAGFKYSRVNFADLLNQTSKIATAPQGELGGKNAMQIGLGTQVSSVTKIFQQGSVQTTDKDTDVAIQGDGFFVISPDGGSTYKFTRNGDFTFDANGNFVDSNGYIVQGWLRNDTTGSIDSTAPIQNITISPGLTTPAEATSVINIKANLNSGNNIGTMSTIYRLDSNHFAYDFDADGNVTDGGAVNGTNGIDDDADTLVDEDYINENSNAGLTFDADGNIIERADDVGVLFSATGEAYNLRRGQGLRMNFDGNIRDDNDNIIAGNNNIFIYSDNAAEINLTGTGSMDYDGDGTADIDTTTYDNVFIFRTTEDLREAMQNLAQSQVTGPSADATPEVTVNERGQYQIALPDGATPGDDAITIDLEGFSSTALNITENTNFTTTFTSLEGSLPEGSSLRVSQTVNAASHASSIDVFDSLGTKHTVRFEFRKTGYTVDGGTTWNIVISVPEPSEINTVEPRNYIEGQITFGSDGSLSAYTPSNLTFTGNNGSSPNQNVNLDFGTAGLFDGMTSFDAESNTSGISQDGYPGGDLSGIRIDETGTLIGSFTNGRSFGLAQIAMAKFTNNEGLESDGGNTFIQTSNSGDPVIGQADTGGRGFIQASSLEMSNVDLSRSLTQLIIVQRGFQANSKSITTSDQMLNTLLQLKQ